VFRLRLVKPAARARPPRCGIRPRDALPRPHGVRHGLRDLSRAPPRGRGASPHPPPGRTAHAAPRAPDAGPPDPTPGPSPPGNVTLRLREAAAHRPAGRL